jgi:hypothetical protein
MGINNTYERLEHYKNLYGKYSNVSKKAFEIKLSYENGPYLINHNETIYELSSFSDLKQQLVDSLSSPEGAMMIPVSLWVDVCEEVHKESKFHKKILRSIDDDKEVSYLNLAINLSIISNNPIRSFWYTLHDLDDIGLYAKAIVAASEVYDKGEIASELTELYIENGSNLLTEMQNGIFDEIFSESEEDNAEEESYYIYEVDPMKWSI